MTRQEAAEIAIPVSRLCDLSAWRAAGPPLWYRPLGAVLAAVRLVLAMLVAPLAIMLPPKLSRPVFWLVRRAMGVRLVCNLPPREVAKLTDGCVVAVNHVSVLDLFAVCGQPQACIIIAQDGGAMGRGTMMPIAQGSGARLWRVADRKQLAQHFTRWRRHPSGTSLYLTPEETIGNQQGLFQFQPSFLARGFPVVPAALRLTTPFGLNADPLLSTKPANFLRLLAMPAVTFELLYLPRLERALGESKIAFAHRVQQAIAQRLGVPGTDCRPEDKHAFRAQLRKADA